MAYLRSFWARLHVVLFSLLGSTTSAAALQDRDLEESMWQRAVEHNTTAAYEVYLRDHPLGRHVRQALERIVEISAISFTGVATPVKPDEPILLAAEDDTWSGDSGEDRDRGLGPY